MELRQLEYFVAVAEEGSFTRAAARVHVAQPGVSAQVRRLERELGEDLLDRSARTVRLTPVGAAVLPYARAALDAVAHARLAVDELAGLVRGHVAVGMLTSFSSDLPDLLAAFHGAHPEVRITLAEANSDDLLAGLQAGRFDVVLAGLAGSPPAGVETEVVLDEAIVAAVARDDALAARGAITLNDIRERPIISLPRGTSLRTALDRACRAAGFEPRIAFEASDPYVLAQLARRGLGVAIVPASLAAAHPDEVHALAFRDPPLRGRVVLAWRAAGSVGPAARAFIAHARTGLGGAAGRDVG